MQRGFARAVYGVQLLSMLLEPLAEALFSQSCAPAELVQRKFCDTGLLLLLRPLLLLGLQHFALLLRSHKQDRIDAFDCASLLENRSKLRRAHIPLLGLLDCSAELLLCGISRSELLVRLARRDQDIVVLVADTSI
eukprot:SAG11_NODE_3719_length_2262_cov_1.462783_2_plen_136_part_00